MGDWWIDDAPYPGPKRELAWPEALEGLKTFFNAAAQDFNRQFLAVGRAFGKSAALAEALKEQQVHVVSGPSLGYMVIDELKEKNNSFFGVELQQGHPSIVPKIRPITNKKHGPYGGGFDRRGRKF